MNSPTHVFLLDSRICPFGQAHLKVPLMLIHIAEHPPLRSSHSLMSVKYGWSELFDLIFHKAGSTYIMVTLK